MHTRPLGRDGPTVSVVGLGCNNFGRKLDRAATRVVVEAALDAGITLFDTADVYGEGASESFLGAALAGRRDGAVVATKFGHPMTSGPDVPRGSPAWIRFAAHASLRRLATDRIDLLQYHRPDGTTPLAETVGGMAELVREGTVRYLGLSNVDGRQIEEAARAAQAEGVPLVSVQNEYSLLQRSAEDDVLPVCARLGLGMLPYFPLASGLLTGKYRRDEPPPAGSRLASGDERLGGEVFDRVEALESYAAARGLSLLEVAIGGLAAQPAVASVIAGATSAEQVHANARAGAWEPTGGDLRELDGLR